MIVSWQRLSGVGQRAALLFSNSVMAPPAKTDSVVDLFFAEPLVRYVMDVHITELPAQTAAIIVSQ